MGESHRQHTMGGRFVSIRFYLFGWLIGLGMFLVGWLVSFETGSYCVAWAGYSPELTIDQPGLQLTKMQLSALPEN